MKDRTPDDFAGTHRAYAYRYAAEFLATEADRLESQFLATRSPSSEDVGRVETEVADAQASRDD